jgi:hypothetical protein
MKISDVKNLWQSDGYTLHLLFLHRAESSIWYLYVTEFCYEMYEYRRHFGIITEVDAKSGDVIRSRVLEYDKSSYLIS